MSQQKKEIIATVNMTAPILFRFMMTNSWQSRNGKIRWISTAIAAPLLLMYIVDGPVNTPMILLSLILVLNLVVQPLNFYLSAKNLLTKEKNYQHPITFTLKKDGILLQQKSGKLVLDWVKFLSIRETRTQIIFFTGVDQVHILPKELLTNDELKTFRGFIVENLTSIKKCNIKKI